MPGKVSLVRAQTQHTQFFYDLYSMDPVMRGHGLHKPIPGPHWRSVIQGLYDGWQHCFIISVGVAYVGHIQYQSLSADDRRAEVSMAIIPSMHRRGYGYDALGQLVDMGFDSHSKGGLGLDCIWAGIIEDNMASRGLFEKNGFEHTGQIPDYYRLSNRKLSRYLYTAKQ